MYHNLKNYYSHLIKQEIGKLYFNMKFILNGLEKYMSFSINNKLNFIDSFQCLSFSLDSSVKRLGKNDFQYFSLKLDCDVLDLIKQKGFYHDNYMNSFEKFKE